MTELKQIRADLDVLITLAESLPKTRETALAFTKLQEGKMHVGNAILELTGVPVYPDSVDPSTDRIDPYHVDDVTPMDTPKDWSISPIGRIKILRRELIAIRQRVKNINLYEQTLDFDRATEAIGYRWEAIIRLHEAQNWYGAELGRIRNANG